MKNLRLLQEEVDRIKNLHDSAPKKLDFGRFEFTINESEEKKTKLMEMLEDCGSMMYEIACMEGKECLESYQGMCESVNDMMETYGKKCADTSISEGWMTEEELNENPIAMSLGRAAAAGAGSSLVDKMMSEEDEEETEE